MISFRINAFLVAAVLCAGAALADDVPVPPPGAVESAPLPDAPNVDSETVPDAPNVPDTTGPIVEHGTVAVGDINVFDGPAVGTIDDAAGGLGRDMWVNTPRDELERLLEATPIASRNGTVVELSRRLLLTESESPVGSGKRALVAIRLQKLLSAGMITEAAQLAAKVRLPNDAELSRVQADALLLGGDKDNACGDATAQRLTNGDVFWLELRAYCFAMAGDAGQVELIDQLLEAQGQTDDAYKMLRDDAVQHLNYMPGAIAAPTSLHVFLLKAAGLPVPPELVARFHLGAMQPVPETPVAGYVVTPEEIARAEAALMALRDADPLKQRHAALVIGLADALGIPMPVDTQAAVTQASAATWPGARPSADEFAKIDDVIGQQGRRGEAILRLVETLDARDLGDMAPDAVVHFVRTLRTLGLENEARAVAANALRDYRDPPPPAPVAVPAQ